MKKEQITKNQGISLVAMFILGSSLLLGASSNAKQDAWMGLIIALAAFVPVVYVCARLMGRYPGKDLFGICTEVFGRVAGKVVIALYTWYAFHLGALVLRNYSEFIQVRVFDQMPQTVSLMLMAVLVVWAARRGVEVLGRWALIALPIILVMFAVVTLLLAKDMHPSFLLPVGENLAGVPKDAFADFSFPLGETILFLGILSALPPGGKPGRAWLFGLLIGWAVLFIGLLRNFMALGVAMHDDKWFPSYDAASLIISGNFISRIENIVGANLLLGGFVKIAVCLMFAAKGTASLFNAEDYRPYVAPLGVLMTVFAGIVYQNVMEMFEFIEVYPYYAFPFQALFPILLCLAAEIKALVKNKKEKGGAPSPAPAGGQG